MPPAAAAGTEHLVRFPPRLWKVVLGFGSAVWVFSAVVTELTGDTILVPTVIVVGSFLVPTTMVAFALSRRREGHLTTEGVVLGFLGAGTLAVVGTALLETYLLPAAAGTFLAVGVIEELGKACVLVAVGSRLRRREPRDGMVLGAVVGAGFAAFESAGYALQTMLDNVDDHTVRNILETEASRALLAPFGHITWTALLGGALFASWRDGRLHVTARLVRTAAGVILLHALWDQTYGTSITLAEGVTGAGLARRLAQRADVVRLTQRGRAHLVQRLLRPPAGPQRGGRRDLDRARVARATGRLAPAAPPATGGARRGLVAGRLGGGRAQQRQRRAEVRVEHRQRARLVARARRPGRARGARRGSAGCEPRRARCATSPIRLWRSRSES